MICVDRLRYVPPWQICDEQARRVGNMWCHMWESDGDLEALHRFAARLGLRREWFQPDPRCPHYDLTAKRRIAATRMGAWGTSLTEWIREERQKER